MSPCVEGPITFEELLDTPQVKAALADGVHDEAHVQLGFDVPGYALPGDGRAAPGSSGWRG